MKLTDSYTQENVRDLQALTFIAILIAVIICTVAKVVGIL